MFGFTLAGDLVRLAATTAFGLIDAPPAIDPNLPLASETIPVGEDELVAEIVRVARDLIERRYAIRPPVKRLAFTKGHGLVKAWFEIRKDVPPELRQGLFAAGGQRYKSWVRFSAQSGLVQSDKTSDGRGLAIKVMGVVGPKLVDAERMSPTMDFLLADYPVAFLRHAEDCLALARAAAEGQPFRFFFDPGKFDRQRLRLALIAAQALSQPPQDVLSRTYWSQTPYRLGKLAVKYQIRPSKIDKKIKSLSSGKDAIFEQLAARLDEDEFHFDFCVQKQLPGMPIEDASVRWDEDQSPFIPVARIVILPQILGLAEHHKLAQELSFNPWQALETHKPLGGLNRLRRGLYRALSRQRHEKNQEPIGEPRSWALDLNEAIAAPMEGPAKAPPKRPRKP